MNITEFELLILAIVLLASVIGMGIAAHYHDRRRLRADLIRAYVAHDCFVFNATKYRRFKTDYQTMNAAKFVSKYFPLLSTHALIQFTVDNCDMNWRPAAKFWGVKDFPDEILI